MKESNFYSDEFEQLIREKTEQYKMYPSEKVWKGIHGSLHTKRKWFIGSMSVLVTGILLIAGKELITPNTHAVLARKTVATPGSNDINALKSASASTPRSSFPAFHQNNSTVTTVSRSGQPNEDITEAESQPYKGVTITIGNPVISQPDLSAFLSHVVKLPAEMPSLPVTAVRGTLSEPQAAKPQEETAGGGSLAEQENSSARGMSDVRNIQTGRNRLAATNADQDHIVGKGAAPGTTTTTAVTDAAAIAEAVDRQRANWLQDYAVYTLTPSPKRARTYLQLTLSPTVNYRTLTGGDFSPPKNIQSPLTAMHAGNASDYVDHAPAEGFELGGSLLYRVTRNLTVKGGLQFSFSRYKIRAYSSSPQQATITLNSYYGYYMDSLNTVSTIRNFGGSSQEIINNDYYQLSAPIGLELRVLGNERLQFNVGATIQPTYLLNTNSYMLTSDYTNYTKEPSLFRRWNFNGGLEAFLSYKTSSGIRWQIGPEFRYQLLSTYNSRYPIHENLKGYGIKIGITKVIP
jgi:hypothetical protein